MWYDEEEDVLGIRIAKGEYWKSVELPSGIVIDVSKDGRVTGLEVFKASKIFSGDVQKVIKVAKQTHGIKTKKTFIEHAEDVIRERKDLLKRLAEENKHLNFNKKKNSR